MATEATAAKAESGTKSRWDETLEKFTSEIDSAIAAGRRLTVRIELGSQNGKVTQIRLGQRASGIVSPLGDQSRTPEDALKAVWDAASESGFFGTAWVEVDLFKATLQDIRSGTEKVHKFN